MIIVISLGDICDHSDITDLSMITSEINQMSKQIALFMPKSLAFKEIKADISYIIIYAKSFTFKEIYKTQRLQKTNLIDFQS